MKIIESNPSAVQTIYTSGLVATEKKRGKRNKIQSGD